MKNKTSVIHFDEAQFNGMVEKERGYQKICQQILDAHKEFGAVFPLTETHQINLLLNSQHGAAAAYRNMIVDNIKIPEVAPGIKMKKEHFVDTLDLPSFSELNTICEAGRSYGVGKSVKIVGDRAVIDEDVLNSLRDNITVYADTKFKEDLHSAHVAAAESMNKLNSLLQEAGIAHMTAETNLNIPFKVIDGNIKARTENYTNRWFEKTIKEEC